jgi:hypothetical protein
MFAVSLLVSLATASVASASTNGREQPALLAQAGTSSTVYLVTSTGCLSPSCLRMYRTTAGASTFTPVTAPPVKGERQGIANTTLSRLVFANVNDGYAEVGRSFPLALYATSNGAKSWRQVTLPSRDDLLGITVTSALVYITMANCSSKKGNCSQYRVWRSSLAARHWTVLPSLWTTGSGPKDNYYGPDVAAFANTVWELETGYQKVNLWISHDKGRTFSHVATPDLVSVAGCSLMPMSLTNLWAECPTGMDVSFLDSHDGGAQWHPFTRGIFSGTGGGDFDPISSNVAYLDYGIVNIRGSNLFRIADGGLRPTAVDSLKCTNISLLFTNESDGLADCDTNYTSNQLLRTADGGSHWESVPLP